MTTSTIEPIRIVLPDAVGGYFRFSDLPRLISKALYPDTKEADADPQGDYYMIRAFEQMRLETDLAQAAALSRGELGYLHVVENSKLKRTLEYRSAGPLSRGIVHLDWLNDWGRANNPAYVFSVAAARKPQADTPIYHFPMLERLEPRTPWAGGRMVDTDVLTLADAASMATKHAGAPVNIGDFLRAAGRGEITLRAIVHRTAKVQKHDGGIYCNGGQENENKVPAGAIATLPLTACQQLAAVGRASWRTFDGFEMVEGILQRYTKGQLLAGEPDFETVPDDCRVVGYDVRALADAFIDLESDTAQAAPKQSAATPAPVVAASASKVHSTKARRDALTPVIELAQKECSNPQDAAEVWGKLLVLANDQHAPFLRTVDEGLDYLHKDTVKTFTRDALRKRLARQAPISAASRR